MNAVEAVEQLGTMGRRLQAREVGLQQPSLRLQAALRQTADWEKVLGDPLATLSQLLGAAGGGQVRAKDGETEPQGPVSSLPLAPFRWEEDRPSAGSGSSTVRSRYTSGQSGDTGSRSGPAGGMRLARRQTSLLDILNANLEDRAHAGLGEQGRREEMRQAGRDAATPELRGPVARWSVVPVDRGEGALSSPLGGQSEIKQQGRQAPFSYDDWQQDNVDYPDASVASLTGQEMVSDRQGGKPGAAAGTAGSSLTAEGDAARGMRVYESLLQPGQEGVHPGGRLGPEDRREPALGAASSEEPDPMLAPASPLVLQSQTRTGGEAGNGNSWQQNTDVVPAAQDSVWATANDRWEERPLSMAQIEQVLSALDERLELMLLRMYGAAGGLP